MNEPLETAITVNGVEHVVAIEPRRTLADVLREDLGLTGTHIGCEQGVCGACTVLLDGAPVRSCLYFGVQAAGHNIETVEGLSTEGALGPLQRAFADNHSLQCGFCTPGFLMLAKAEIDGRQNLSREQIRLAMSANICRCTGYQAIVDAIESLAGHRTAKCPTPDP